MHVGSGELDAYTGAVSGEQRAAQAYVEKSLRAYVERNPDSSVADIREYGKAVLSQAFRMYGDRAAVLACMEYDRVARALGYDLAPAGIANEWDEGGLDRDVRYLAGRIAEGDFGGFVSQMGSRAYDHALKAANSTMHANATRDPDRKAGMRYARVPTGRETCGFCLMLASLGFNYTSRRAAGDIGRGFNTYHRHCDCRVVVGDEHTTVEGYDPDWYYEVYSDAAATVGTTERNAVAAEINRRSREWAWNGRKPQARYTKPRESLEPHERAGIDKLLSHGFDVETIPEDPKAAANLDIVMGGKAWEMKNVTNAGSSVINQINRAKKKFRVLGNPGSALIVLTTEGYTGSLEELVAAVEKRGNFKECLIVYGNRLLRLRK